MNETCDFVGEACFEGRGTCSDSLICLCNKEFVQSSDLVWFTHCSHDLKWSQALYGLDTSIWIFSFLGMIVTLFFHHRKEKVEKRWELWKLYFLLSVGLLHLFFLCWVLSADPYGSRSVGSDITATCIFSLTNLLSWFYLLFKPIVGMSSLSSGMFTYAPASKRYYGLVLPVLLFLATSMSLIPFGIYFSPSHQVLLLFLYYLGGFLIGLVLLLLHFIVLYNIHKHVKQALLVVPNGQVEIQRDRFKQYLRRATRVLGVLILAILVMTIMCLIFAIDTDLAQTKSWVFVPLPPITLGLFVLHGVYISMRISWNTRKIQLHSSSGHYYEDDDDEGEEKRDESSQQLQGLSRFSSSSIRRNRKIRGIKRKPLELMTAVTENTQEGTVLFTHVEGLENDASLIGDLEKLNIEKKNLDSSRFSNLAISGRIDE